MPGVAPAATDGDHKAMAAYLRARAADADGRPRLAAAGYATALAALPGDEVIAIRAYRQALTVGDMALADRAAAILRRSNVAPNDAEILLLSSAIAADDLREAEAAIDRIASGSLDFLAPVMRGWLALERGEDNAAALLDVEAGNPIGARYARSHRALILLAQGKIEDGVAATRAALGADAGNLDLRLAAAARLADKGQRQTAEALLTGNDPVMVRAREQLGDKRRRGDGATTAAEGIALLLTQLAADIGAEGGSLLGIALSRAALRLDPDEARTRLVLARALAEDTPELALAEIARIGEASPLAPLAAAQAAMIRSDMGDTDSALALAHARATEPDAAPAFISGYADLLTNAGRHAEAAAEYGRAADALRAEGRPVPWTLLLQRGAALEQADRWAEAKPLLEAALAAAPEEPVVLNYLGYSQVERGENLAAAEALIAKAVALRPDDGAIIDSLGWAQYMQGRHKQAVETLEQAAKAEPADPEINEHLGDAYWAVGRRFEARYAWRAARLYADDEASARIAGKISNGLQSAAR
ncbi:tetratricopeptide repeat protein [Sphingomonas gilva]|uniref:Tetratricopeptide repeat protein n=1 Tax=Sphingomonas gilva TaxID=2305907 RepID=A0A396RLP3_9SPHN|nr:tetratricopeptide repeat protein [Sphingomonas gilva]RHW17238.1 tetratricopeptide repeat protein [Sphingomonas gilva]